MSRIRAREAAFKALFQLDFNFEEEDRENCENLAIKTMFDDEPRLTLKTDMSFIEELVKGTRMTIYEMKFANPPLSKNIAINEAVEIAKKYGTDDSGRFVNGILEAISK